MTKTPVQDVSAPRSAQPFNRRLLAQGYTLPPGGPMHRANRRHFVRQEWIGTFLALVIFFATAYGITREFVRPLLLIAGLALLVTVVPARRRARRRPRR